MDAAPIREARANAIWALCIDAANGSHAAGSEVARAAAEGHTTEGVRRWIEEASEAADAADEAADEHDNETAETHRREAKRAYQRAAALLVRQMNRAALAQIRA